MYPPPSARGVRMFGMVVHGGGRVTLPRDRGVVVGLLPCVWGGGGWEGGLASGRLTRSTRRREDTESGFEVGLCVDSSSSIRPLLGRTGTRPRSLIEGIVLFLGLQSIFRSEVSLSFRRGLLMRL